MGAWGLGPLDNDIALDFLVELEESVVSTVKEAFKEVIAFPSDQYMDFDIAYRCWAGCEIVALSRGHDSLDSIDSHVLNVVKKVKSSKALPDLAMCAVQRLLEHDQCELFDDDDHAANAQIRLHLEKLTQRISKKSVKLVYKTPKRGEIYLIPFRERPEEYFAVQVRSAWEVVVWEGAHSRDADLVSIASKSRGKIVRTHASELMRSAVSCRKKAIRPPLNKQKIYSARSGNPYVYFIEYSRTKSEQATYDDVKAYEENRYYRRENIEEVTADINRFDAIISPSQWDQLLHQQYGERWQRRREESGPGPFDDLAQIQKYVDWINWCDLGVKGRGWSNAFRLFRNHALCKQEFGFFSEETERKIYLMIGIICIWRGKLEINYWPHEKVDKLPALNNQELLASLSSVARDLMQLILLPGSELRFIWFNNKKNQKAIEAWVQKLSHALED